MVLKLIQEVMEHLGKAGLQSHFFFPLLTMYFPLAGLFP